jgi:hypothetical protein
MIVPASVGMRLRATLSFVDFTTNCSRCVKERFYIDPAAHHGFLAERCITHLERLLVSSDEHSTLQCGNPCQTRNIVKNQLSEGCLTPLQGFLVSPEGHPVLKRENAGQRLSVTKNWLAIIYGTLVSIGLCIWSNCPTKIRL